MPAGLMRTRRILLSAVVLLILSLATSEAQQLQHIRFGFGGKTVSPLIIDALIPERLGYFRDEGLTVEFVPMGSSPPMYAGLASKRLEFAVGTPAFILPLVAKGESVPVRNFFEYTYPFKWSLAVKPDGTIRSFAALRGKRIGVSGLGTTDLPVGKAVAALAGLDPEKDLGWLSVGEGVPAGLALERGDVDALFTYDTVFGAIEAANIKLTYIPLPQQIPKVGGLYLATTPEILQGQRSMAVGFARAVAKAHVFILENPEAAAYVFAEMFPEALPKGQSLADQVAAIMVPTVKRMQLYTSYDKSVKQWGYMKESEWRDEVRFLGLDGKVSDFSTIYTNDLIDEINRFDAGAIRQQARTYKLPYKTR